MRIGLMLYTFFILSACSTTLNSNFHDLNLDLIEKFKINENSEADVIALLGKPDLKNQFTKDYFALIYLTRSENPTTRASFIFNVKTNRLESINWFLRETEPYSDFELIKSKFHNSEFKKEPSSRSFVNGKSTYVAQNSNIAVVISKKSNKVSSIRWGSPFENQRGPANTIFH